MQTLEVRDQPMPIENLAVMPGMESLHDEVLVPFGIQTAELIAEEIESGKHVAIACFLNGAIIPVAQTFAQLKRYVYEGVISPKTFQTAVENTILFERIRSEDKNTRKKVTHATLVHPDIDQKTDMAVMVDDVVETVETADDLKETFPHSCILLAAPIKKHKTNEPLQQRGYPAQFITEVGNAWLLSGCGMDGSNTFTEKLNPHKYATLSVLQRVSNVGIYKQDPQADRQPTYQELFDFFCQKGTMLPWVTELQTYDLRFGEQAFLDDLIMLEMAKEKTKTNGGDHHTQMMQAHQILTKLNNLAYPDILKITS